jgi:dTDP-4-dehydrorhamnose reductase
VKILIIGKNGQVGWELQRALAPLGQVVALERSEMDLADADSIRRVVRDLRPDVVINAAAYTAVDRAESERDLAMAVNGIAPGILAEETARLGALLIHYSTDYVFDGRKPSPYVEDDAPNPLNAYGESKLAGERAIQEVGGRHMILRTSWVYGPRGKNFMLTILRLANEHDEIRVVNDQIGAPTSSRAVADATYRIVERRLAGEDRAFNGVFHLTASGSTSWFGFAQAIIAQTQDRRERSPRLVPVASADYPSAAKRPLNSMLSSEKARRLFGIALDPWDVEVRRLLAGPVR